MQLQIVDSSDTTEAEARETAATAIHQRAADRAERAGHRVASPDGFVGRVGRQLVFAADVNH